MKAKSIFTIILLAIVLHVPTLVSAQTQQDTENWILAKIRKHHNEAGHPGILLFSCLIEKGVLIVSQYFTHELKPGGEYLKSIKVVKYHIPIWAITDAVYHDGGILINTESHVDSYVNSYIAKPDDRAMSRYEVLSNHTYIKDYDGKKHYTSYQVKLTTTSPEPEDDFLNRFNKALTHLKTFYPKPGKPNETF